ncbi:DUF4291 domain-containing protein [Paenibacillus sp. LS1]|uniref:DUF4291 domain-containing protein n=1 Tax=Paenibacillus sp. LS1 TaxID=2992120 RepID=UPI0022304487|nr:DUF4291 domain-containing protein [Paenibacillus sp. LS1]MCW3791430.1 DUF4291 domain-containing protein [Paenibacillus sp. LS1]
MRNKSIYATYSDQHVTVYQAFGNKIADELLLYGKFGSYFSLSRVSWIKTSFLWMMHRSEWASKRDQERIFSIQITKEGFDYILSQAVLTKFRPKIHSTSNEWKQKLNETNVLCQMDPDRDLYGNELQRKAVQLGLKNEILIKYVNEFIVGFSEITDKAKNYKRMILNNNLDISLLPLETKYSINDAVAMELGLSKGDDGQCIQESLSENN